MLSCVRLSPDRPQARTHAVFVGKNADAAQLGRPRRSWSGEAEEFAEGFSASLSLITTLIKVYWLIVAGMVFLYAAYFLCASVLLITELMVYWSSLLWTPL